MQTFLILCLGFSCAVSLLYLIKGYRSYQVQLDYNTELKKALQEIEELKRELLLEQAKLKQVARQVSNGIKVDPATPETISVDIKGKPWLN